MIEYQDARRVAGVLAAVGEPTRMLILHQLTQAPQYVGQLSEQLGIPMVNMSHHLGVMRQAGLVEDTKQGRRVLYALNPEIFSAEGPKNSLGTLDLGHLRLILCEPPADQSSSQAVKNAESKSQRSAKPATVTAKKDRK